MNKKIIVLVILVVALVACLTACNNSKTYKQDAVSGFDANAVVENNGGLVVKQGNQIYYINAYSGVDADNTFGNQLKTCLMRATVADDGSLTDKIVMVPKNIYSASTTSGIYIYNGWIYYASPNVDKNKSGEINDTYLDFFRTSLDRTTTELLYTIDNRAANFRFTGDSLFVVSGTEIMRLDLNKKNAKKIFDEKNYVSILDRVSSVTPIAVDNAFANFTFVIQTAPEEDASLGYNTLGVLDSKGNFTPVITKGKYTKEYTIAILDYVKEGDALTLFYTKTATADDGVSSVSLCSYKFADTSFAFDKANEKLLLNKYSGSAVEGISYADGALMTLAATPFVVKVTGNGSTSPLSTTSTPDAAIAVKYVLDGYMYYTLSSTVTALYRFAINAPEGSDTRITEKVCDIGISTSWLAPELLDGYMYYLDGTSNYINRVKLGKAQSVEVVGTMTADDAKTYAADEE